ncbi:MAG: hypothetical protein IKN66_11505 [Ruminococcus sp.]|nr:hypothetical protein [Ruminococcus sp.]
MKVAILDDGICQAEIKTKVERYCVGNSVNRNCAFDDKSSHATICAKIIEKYSSPEKIYDIVFLGNDDLADPEDIIAALEFCLGLDIDVINLSNGIEVCGMDNPFSCRLRDICEKLKEKGVRIFAAQSNSGMLTVPAMFDSTVSVEQIGLSSLMRLPYRVSDIYTNGAHLIRSNGKKRLTVRCNSYACPYAAAKYINDGRLDLHRVTCDVRLMDKKPKRKGGKLAGFEICSPYSGESQGYVFFDRVSPAKRMYYRSVGQRLCSLHYGRLFCSWLLLNSVLYKKCDTPVVCIKNRDGSGRLASMLLSELSSDGYSAAFLSINKKHYYYGACYVPGELIMRYINYYSAVNSPDIIIVVNDRCGADDIMISCDEKGYSVISGNRIQSCSDLAEVKDAIYRFYK